jgi:hypothetical protein
LERVLDLTNQGPLILLTGFQTPAAIRELGIEGLRDWLRLAKSVAPASWPLEPLPQPTHSGSRCRVRRWLPIWLCS